jgi:hypothetical protein
MFGRKNNVGHGAANHELSYALPYESSTLAGLVLMLTLISIALTNRASESAC